MGQKVNPTSLRLGVNRTWDSRWYADDKYADYLHEDVKIKEFLKDKLKNLYLKSKIGQKNRLKR